MPKAAPGRVMPLEDNMLTRAKVLEAQEFCNIAHCAGYGFVGAR